jgi:S1-C subfamily serine protease
MVVPIDDLKPVLDDLMKFGKPNTPPRPWLGLYATEVESKIVVVGLASRGPAQKADIRTGDIIVAVDGREVSELATMFRKVWSLGHAGVDVPLLVYRDGRTFEMTIKSGDRNRFLKGPSVH